MALNYNTMTIDDIIDYCVNNNEVAWLKEVSSRTTAYKVYPRIKVDGKSVADKSQKPITQHRKISFIEIKTKFVEKFMPEIAPKKKEEKPTFYDRIAALK